MALSLRRDERGASPLWSFIGVVVLVAAILGVYYGYVVPKFAPPPLRAQSGDQVQVDYVGTFAENGLVFDTSVAAIAKDNASYPKAFMFAGHGEYAPLPVTVGSGGVVPGFDIGIQGLAIGDSKRIVVPPALGYGLADPTKIFVKPLLETVPVRLTMDTSSFVATYQTAAISGTNVTDPFWGWTATVSVAGTIVTVTNSPIPGQLVRPQGAWDAEVVSIDDAANAGEGAILVHHLLTPAMVDRVGEKNAGGTVVFVVTSVDTDAGTYTLNYNNPTKGRTLVFQVTMLSISRLYLSPPMASLDELLTSLFGSLWPGGSLVILVIIFALDAALFPALPEVWIVVTYTYRPTEMLGPVAWAGLLLAMAVAGTSSGRACFTSPSDDG